MITVIGSYKAKITDEYGNVTEYPEVTNQTQDGMGVLIASLCGNFDAGAGDGIGINQVAFGTGNELWYESAGVYYEEPVRSKAATVLYNEFAVAEIPENFISYVDPSTYEAVSYKTNTIKVTIIRGVTATDETHGEVALYSAINPAYNTSTTGRLMLNWGVHSAQYAKSANSTLEIPLILKFVNI